MDYFKIKAEAEAIRDEAGLPAQYYPVLIHIQDEPVYNWQSPVTFEPHCRISLGREFGQYALQLMPAAINSFKSRVLQEAGRAAWESRRHDIRARWAARRATRQ